MSQRLANLPIVGIAAPRHHGGRISSGIPSPVYGQDEETAHRGRGCTISPQVTEDQPRVASFVAGGIASNEQMTRPLVYTNC